jgi:hypothetical protein
MGTGKDMFYSLMNRIKSDGIDVNRIRGSWYSDTGSVNYETFKSLLDGGVGSESAALRTWTGQRAQEFGFDRVESVTETMFGDYQVIFTKSQ